METCRRNSVLPLVVVIVVAVTRLSGATGTPATAIQILPLTGEPNSASYAINDFGTVIGASGTNQSFAWSSHAGTTVIDYVDQIIDVTDIADTGTFVGRARWPGHDWQGYVWSSSSGTTYIGSLGGIRSAPAAINNNNTVVGVSTTAGFIDHAFRWTPTTGMQDLGAFGRFGGTTTDSRATGISDTEVVVGYSDSGGAFRWTAQSGLVPLGTLGGSSSYASGISRDGRYIVGWADDLSGFQRPFVWTADTALRDLGTFGGSYGQAVAVNNAGAAVGYAADATGVQHVVLWSPSLPQPIDLNTLMNPDGPPGDWFVTTVTDINDLGQITGFGDYFPSAPGASSFPPRAFVLDVSAIPGVTAVPEPAALLFASVGCMAICAARRSRSNSAPLLGLGGSPER